MTNSGTYYFEPCRKCGRVRPVDEINEDGKCLRCMAALRQQVKPRAE